MKQLVFASNNANKLREVRAIFSNFEILSLKDIGLVMEIEETGATFEENSFIKAKAVYDKCNIPTLADDSGLMVDALDGAPGVFSARYSGENATDKTNNELLLENLRGKENREAKFVSVITFYDGNNVFHTVGETAGRILEEAKGNNGFGYDSLFFSYELGKSFGEVDENEKNKVSHRAKALNRMEERLKKI